MSVLVLSEVLPPEIGGSGRWAWELYRRWPATTVAFATHAEHESVEILAGHRVVRMPMQLPSWGVASAAQLQAYQRQARQVWRVAKSCGATLIHANRALPQGLVALTIQQLRGTPFIVTVHGEELNSMNTSRELRLLGRLVLRSASRIVANSRHTASLLVRDWRVPEHNIITVTPGVDLQQFRPADPHEIGTVRASFGWHDRCVLLTAARLQARKGHDMMLRALPALAEASPNLVYAIAGDGPERSRLVELAHELGVAGQVQMLGRLSDARLREAYQACDLFALPNRDVAGDFEGFGLVLLEAQACGRPVLAGQSGGTAEAMLPGVSGHVVDCSTPAPLVSALRPLVRDASRREAIGRAGRAWVEQHFDWDHLSQHLRQSLEAAGLLSDGDVLLRQAA